MHIRKHRMPTPSKRLATLAAMVLTTAVSAHIQADSWTSAKVPQATIQQWQSACNNDAFAQDRIHRLSAEDTLNGLARIREAGDTKALAGLDTREACLSLAASAVVNRSVIVMTKGIDPEADIHPGIVTTNPTLAKSMSLAHRLDSLDPSVHDPQWLNSPEFQDISRSDPGLAKSILNNGYAQNIQIEKRSFSLYQDNAPTCLVVLESTPVLDDFLILAPARLSQGLTPQDRHWLTRYGMAVEFWHEVGHCQTTEDLQLQAELAGVDMSGPAETDAQTCSAMQSGSALVSELSETQQLLEQASYSMNAPLSDLVNPLAGAQSSPVPPLVSSASGAGAADQTAFGDVIDNRLLLELSVESLMDRYALNMTAKRFGLTESGCTMSTEITHPWDRLRALWSIGDPDIHYMTWLAPWLADQPNEVRRQVLADAWGGLLQAKKTASGRAFYQDWMMQRLSEQRQSGAFHTPTLTANPERMSNWQSWLTGLTGQPSGVRAALE